MKRTLERRIGNDNARDAVTTVGRFALTLTMADQEAKRVDASDHVIASVLAQAMDLVQRVLYPSPAEEYTHPRDTALFERVSDGTLVRIRCQAEDLPALAPAYRYLVGAYDDHGRLLPTFWALPLIDVSAHLQVNTESTESH